MDSIILIIILIALIESAFKKVDIFNEFIEGVKEGSKLLMTLFPTMMAFTLWVTCFQSCGIINILELFFKNIFQFLNIPIDIFMMMIVRPFSSNGSLTVLNNVFLMTAELLTATMLLILMLKTDVITTLAWLNYSNWQRYNLLCCYIIFW